MNDREPAREACFALHASHEIDGEEDGTSRDGRKDVSRKLRLRNREENDRDDQPAAREHTEVQLQIGLRAHFPSFAPPDANRFRRSCDDEGDPRNQRERRDGDVVPEGLWMMVEIAGEAGEIVLENKLSEELRVPQVDRDVP